MGRLKPIKNLSDLKVGDVIRGKVSHRSFVVTANYGTRVTAVHSADITNPMEWEIVSKKD